MSKRCLGCMELFGDEFEICPHCGYVVGTGAEEAVHMEPGTILHDRYIIGKVLGLSLIHILKTQLEWHKNPKICVLFFVMDWAVTAWETLRLLLLSKFLKINSIKLMIW